MGSAEGTKMQRPGGREPVIRVVAEKCGGWVVGLVGRIQDFQNFGAHTLTCWMVFHQKAKP